MDNHAHGTRFHALVLVRPRNLVWDLNTTNSAIRMSRGRPPARRIWLAASAMPLILFYFLEDGGTSHNRPTISPLHCAWPILFPCCPLPTSCPKGPVDRGRTRRSRGFPDILELWRDCHAPGLLLRRTGRRYLRLDSAVDGYARLSPSIRREFLTYTLVGLPGQEATPSKPAPSSWNADISREKIDLARESICMALAGLPDEPQILKTPRS